MEITTKLQSLDELANLHRTDKGSKYSGARG